MEISVVSIEQYLNLPLDQKIDFYKKIQADSSMRTVNKDVQYTKFKRQRQTKSTPTFLFHQNQGRLSFVDEPSRIDKQDKKVYYLCLCDCGSGTSVGVMHF